MPYSLATIIKWSTITICVLAVVGYGIFEARHLIRGPILSITEPENGAVVHNARLVITGHASNISFITLNNRDIFTNENGDFREELLLRPGYSIIEISVTDRFKRTQTYTREVFYDAPREALDPDAYTVASSTHTNASSTEESLDE